MSKFPIKVDLSEFFDDERRLVMLLVDPAWKNIEGLQRRLESIFNIGKVAICTIDRCYIPASELIELLHFIDFVKAFTPSKLTVKNIPLDTKSSLRTKEEQELQLDTALYISTLSCNFNDPISNCQSSKIGLSTKSKNLSLSRNDMNVSNTSTFCNQAKRYKNQSFYTQRTIEKHNLTLNEETNSVQSIIATYTYSDTNPVEEVLNKKYKSINILPPIEIVDIDEDVNAIKSLKLNKKKRKRCVKKNHQVIINHDQIETQNSKISKSTQHQPPFVNRKILKICNSPQVINNHIYFPDDKDTEGENIGNFLKDLGSNTITSPSKFIFSCPLEGKSMITPRVFDICISGKK